jgi:GntR family transcriptional repressor for pyruvate dehydrogenase complex
VPYHPKPKVSDAEPVFQPLRREPAYKAVCHVMEQHIVAGRLKPGTALPAELDLAAQFGVNRSTLREAIRQLEQEGLVERRGGKKLFVALPGLFDLAPRAARSLTLNQVTFQELWETAFVVEPEAARLAALRRDDDDLAQLEANIVACRTTLGVPGDAAAVSQHAAWDVEFHALVARASRNRSLMLAREPFSLLYRPALTLLQEALPQAASRNVRAHEALLEAMRKRQADRAQDWVRKHMIDFRAGFLKAGLPMDTPVGTLASHAHPAVPVTIESAA